MWTLLTFNGLTAVLPLVLLGAVVSLTHRWLGPPESGADDGGADEQLPAPQAPRGPFDALGFSTHSLPAGHDERLGLSA